MIDLIVAGGGPVGLATASCAALAGLQVVVVEPRAGVVDKACGEGLMPGALAQLGALGIDPPGVELSGIRYLSGPHAAEARFTAGPARGVRRTTLHEAMVTRALDLGVRIVRGRVVAVEQGAQWVQAADLRGRYLIGADGLHSGVRRALGLGGPAARRRRFGVRQHFAVAPWSDLVEVHWLPRHEVYVTPVASGTVGVALLGPAPLSLDAAITALPTLARRIHGAAVASPLRGAGPFGQSSTRRVAGRVLLVGDAAGYVDALTGEGLRVGLAQARAAVEAIAGDDPHAYEDKWRRITRSYRTVTHTLLWVAARRTLRPLIVPAARSMPRTFTRVVDEIAG